MAIRSIEEIMSSVRARVGEDTSDEALSFVEDISDTLSSMRQNSGEDWRAKYEQNDAEWRAKYRDRFFNPAPDPDPDPDPDLAPKAKTYEDLFKEE